MAIATTEDRESKPAVATDDCPECLAENLSWLLTQAHFNLVSEISAAFEPIGVSNRGYHVLTTALGAEHTQKELAELIGLDKTTMVVTLDHLELDGLAVRRPSPTDRRVRVIEVTDAGKRKVAEGKAVVERVQAEVLEKLPAPERQALLSALERLACPGNAPV